MLQAEGKKKKRLFTLLSTQEVWESVVKGLSKYLAKNNLSKTELLLLQLQISASE